ncbi:hypothetical protein PAHAL_4G026100 [Panicum hallii]|uniref:aminodeoxychorismate synthase n=1 Tax=Panicum hallii TaxID=206008 RepID=A0A2S3HGM6_9POAL|nr:hypothetical protein PAHAL_4G026100 [Panicum hallii]
MAAALRLPAPPAARWAPLPPQVPASASSSAARRVRPPRRLAARRAKGEEAPEPVEAQMPVRTLLIDNYDSYTYNIFQELSVVNGVPPVVVRNDEWTWRDVFNRVYKDRAFDNIVISPGPGSPACPADIGVCLRILLECGDIPILGVCLGHQALGFIHGAKIVHAPEAIHGRLSEIEHDGCYLFNCIPSGRNSGFKVVRYHSLVIEPGSLPDDLISIAWTSSPNLLSYLESDRANVSTFLGSLDNNFMAVSLEHSISGGELSNISNGNASESDGSRVIMAIKHSSRPQYGVQFHPESVATHYGRQIFQNFKKITRDFGLRSSWLQERKVKSAGQCGSVSKDLLHTERLELLEPNGARMLAKRALGKKCLRLRWKKIDNFLCPAVGSEDIFAVLFGHQSSEDTFWLDSSSVDQNRARFSFMGGKGGSLWKQMTFHLSGQRANCGGTLTTRDAYGSTANNFIKEGFLEFLNKEIQSIQYNEKDYEGLPFDFHGGFVGYLGEKDQAENLMIVDLLRNDLGKVCEPGSVHVPRLMDVESYKAVHTMVSTIRGTKKLNLSPVDCVKASFPGGSMTGAPKVRSMEILDSLESSPRGIYSGSIGFFSYNHTFDLNIVIRTVILHNGEATVGAGGAIVALSNPEAEYDEMMLKARAPTKVVEDCSQTIYSSDRLDSMQATTS